MQTKTIILLIVIAVLAAGACLVRFQTGTLAPAGAGAARAQAHHESWYCPMHPWILYNHPGRCPICGMDLVKKEDSGAKETGGAKGYITVTESPQRQQLIGLRTDTVTVRPLEKLIRTFGTISSDATLYQTQTEFIDAFVAYVTVFRDYRKIRDRLHIWESHRDVQTRLVQAKDKLLKLGLSEAEIEQLQDVSWNQLWKQPKLLMFKGSRNYWVLGQIFEQDYAFVKPGQLVEVNIPSLHDKVKGTVRSVGGFIDPSSRSVTALIELGAYDRPLASNMQVDITIPVNLGEALLVPHEAVMDTGLRKIVFVSKDGDTFEPREIQTGLETEDGFEVTSGLKAGDRIVTGGNFLLDSESRIQAGLQGGSHD